MDLQTLPKGIFIKKYPETTSYFDLSSAVKKDIANGYLLVSATNGNSTGAIELFSEGQAIAGYFDDGHTILPDPGQKHIISLLENGKAAIELYLLRRSQVEAYKDHFDKRVSEAPSSAAKADGDSITSELQGRLIRAIKIDSLASYLSHRSTDTGHIIMARQDRPGNRTIYHILIIGGRPVAVYSESTAEMGRALLDQVMSQGGIIEYYANDEKTLRAVMEKYPMIAVEAEMPVQAPHVVDVAPVIALKTPVAATTLETPKAPVTPVADASKGTLAVITPEAVKVPVAIKTLSLPVSGLDEAIAENPVPHIYGIDDSMKPHISMQTAEPGAEAKGENDVDFVKNIEDEFVSNVDDLLKRLNLTHLKPAQK